MKSSDSEPALEVDVQTVKARLDGDSAEHLLLDCREPAEHEIAHLPGATLIPMGEIAERLAELESHRERPVVVYCHHGGRSLQVTHYLRRQGFSRAQNMAGGIDAWAVQIDPNMPRY